MRIILLLMTLTLVPGAANYILGSNEGTLAAFALEAEQGLPAHPMVVQSDASASGGAYIYSNTYNEGRATFTVDLADADDYVIWCRVLVSSTTTDSFYVSADGGPEDVYDAANNTWSDSWQWTRVNGRADQGTPLALNPRVFQLSAGMHEIVFRAREMHTKLDSLVITNDFDFVPGEPVNTPTPTPTPTPAWTNCAREGGQCSFTGTQQVRYGANGSYAYGTFSGGVLCSNSVFGDPVYGVEKACDYSTQTVQPTPTPTPTPPPPGNPPPPPTPVQGREFYVSPQGRPDGNGSQTNPWDLVTAVKHPPAVRPGDTLYIRGGTYSATEAHGQGYWNLNGTAPAPIKVRPYPGERVTIDVDYILNIQGSYTHYIGLEIMSSHPNKVLEHGWSPNRPGGVTAVGKSNKLINCVLHDLSELNSRRDGVDFELYGNLMYYFGFLGDVDRPWGTTAYIQNDTGTKVIADNFMFHQFMHNLQLYGTDAAILKDVHIEGNVLQGTGDLSGVSGFNAIAWVGETPAERISFIDNVSYPGNAVFWGAGGAINRNFRFSRNLLIGGGSPPIRMGRWDPTEFKGNLIEGTDQVIWHEMPFPGPGQFDWDNNQYFLTGKPDQAFSLNWELMGFDAWKRRTGADQNSTVKAGRSNELRIIVRPNKYERGRAHITVYNPGLANTASVSLAGTGLTVGQAFEIRDAQNFFGPPVHSGSYQGSPVTLTLPDTNSPVSPIVGANNPRNFVPHPPQHTGMKLPVHTSREINMFVLLPR